MDRSWGEGMLSPEHSRKNVHEQVPVGLISQVPVISTSPRD